MILFMNIFFLHIPKKWILLGISFVNKLIVESSFIKLGQKIKESWFILFGLLGLWPERLAYPCFIIIVLHLFFSYMNLETLLTQ